MDSGTTYLPPTTQAYATALLGPAFMGWIVHLLLCGVLLSHFSAYLATDLYRTDPCSTKVLVWLVLVLDLAITGMNAEQMFHYGTSQHRDYWSVAIIRVFDSVPFLLTAVSGALLQSFLTRRASKLFHSNLLAQQLFVGGFHLLILVAFLGEVGEMVVATLVAKDPMVDTRGFTFNVLGSIWLWTSTVVDGSLSLALFLLLRRKYDGSLDSIRSVVRVSFQTALLTSVFSLTGAACGTAFPGIDSPRQNVILAFCIPLSSLYALSLIVTLASRQEHVAEVKGSTLAGYPQSALLDGLAGAQAGVEMSSKPGMQRGFSGVPLVAKRGAEADLDSDDDEDEYEMGDGRGWHDQHRRVDVEMGTDEDEGEPVAVAGEADGDGDDGEARGRKSQEAGTA